MSISFIPLKFVNGLQAILDSKVAIKHRYADIAAMLADQSSQASGELMKVTDASADPAVNSGGAYYDYLGTPTGDLADYTLNSTDAALETTPFTDIDGFDGPPPSPTIRVYNNNEANAATYGRLYTQADAFLSIPVDWRLPTEAEMSGVTGAESIALGGRWNSTAYENKDIWLNCWIPRDGDPNNLDIFFSNGTVPSEGSWGGLAGYAVSLVLIKEVDDGRSIGETSIVTINGEDYNTKKLANGEIYMLDPYRGFTQNPTRKLTLRPNQSNEWVDDVVDAHTHLGADITDLRDDSIVEDYTGFLPNQQYRFIDHTDDVGTFLTRTYTTDSIKNSAIPAGWRVPTRADMDALFLAAGFTLNWTASGAVPSPAAITALKVGGALGFNMQFRGYWHFEHINDVSAPLPSERIFNQSVPNVSITPYADFITIFTFDDGTAWDSAIYIVDTTQFPGFNTYAGTDWLKNQFMGFTRLIKEDGIIGGGTAEINGVTYNLVDIGGTVWLSEDYRGPQATEPTKLIKKEDSVIKWVVDTPPDPQGEFDRWYVDPNYLGGDSDGTPQKPFLTIQAANDAAQSGDMIFLGPGIYSASATITKWLTIVGAGKDHFAGALCSYFAGTLTCDTDAYGGTIYLSLINFTGVNGSSHLVTKTGSFGLNLYIWDSDMSVHFITTTNLYMHGGRYAQTATGNITASNQLQISHCEMVNGNELISDRIILNSISYAGDIIATNTVTINNSYIAGSVSTPTSTVTLRNSTVLGAITAISVDEVGQVRVAPGIIYVSKLGDNTTGDGSAQKPYLTIANTITEAVNGDIIMIGSGTYSESVSTTKNLSFIGLGGRNKVILSQLTLSDGSVGVYLSGLNLTQLSFAVQTGGQVLYTVENCNVTTLSVLNDNYAVLRNCQVGTSTINGALARAGFFNCTLNQTTLTTAGARLDLVNCSQSTISVTVNTGTILVAENSHILSIPTLSGEVYLRNTVVDTIPATFTGTIVENGMNIGSQIHFFTDSGASSYTPTRKRMTLIVSTGLGSGMTINLPDIGFNYGDHVEYEYMITHNDTATDVLTLDPFGTQTINGLTTTTIPVNSTRLLKVAEPGKWRMINF